jgi:hypothetical protein
MDGGREPGFHERGLEHFLAARLTRLSPGEVCIDVAKLPQKFPESAAKF